MKELRICGGTFIHKKIVCPPGIIRPAMSQMREALFQILDNKLHFSKFQSQISQEDTAQSNPALGFLDLFSGSGLMAIEAISRGMHTATVVEKDKLKWDVLSKNVQIANGKIQKYRSSVEKFLRIHTTPYDILYADPPFNYAHTQDLVSRMIESRSIHEGSVLVIHVPRQQAMLERHASFSIHVKRNYGGSHLYIYASA